MTRTTLRLLLAGAVALGGLTACGSNDEDAAAPKATPSPTEAPLTKAEAEAIAKASVLKAADLPGFQSTPADTSEDADEAKAEAELETCVGAKAPDYLAEVSSDDFAKGEPPAAVEVSSEVSIVPTQAVGEADLAAFTSDKALTCFQQFFDKAIASEIGEQGVTVTGFKGERFDVVKPAAASSSFGLRFSGTIAGAGLSFPLSIEVAGALVERAEVSVLTFALGEPLPRAELERLLGLVSTRAAAAQA